MGVKQENFTLLNNRLSPSAPRCPGSAGTRAEPAATGRPRAASLGAPAREPALPGTRGAAGQDLSPSPTTGRTGGPVGHGAASAPRRVSQITQQKPALFRRALERPQTGSPPTLLGEQSTPSLSPRPPELGVRGLAAEGTSGTCCSCIDMDHLHPTCSQGAGGSESITALRRPLPAARPQGFVFFREDLSLKGGKKKK